MTYDLFGRSYVFLDPSWFWLLVLIPLLWLPLFWQRGRGVLFSAVVLRTLAVVALVAALAGLNLQTTLSEHQLALVAALDTSDSISRESRQWMNDYLAQLRGYLTDEEEFSALSFASDTTLLIPPGPPTSVSVAVDPDEAHPGGGTNIAEALERVFALYPEQAQKRLLLMTDGNETTGSARQHLALARQMGVSIFPVIPPSGQQPEIDRKSVV